MTYDYATTTYALNRVLRDQERHVVYATTRCGLGHKVYRVSDDLLWDVAQARWNGLDVYRRAGNANVGGVPVLYFSVRSADDPDWPWESPEYHVLVPKLPGVIDFGYEVLR